MAAGGVFDKVERLGSILGVWAHPDDETFMVGGLMAAAAKNGQMVACLTATRGELGVQDDRRWPAGTLAVTRERELDKALSILGVIEHHWLDYQDGRCSAVDPAEAVDRVLAFIEKYQPDTVITFPPDGGTGHPDHITVSNWARAAAARRSKPPKVYFAANLLGVYNRYLAELDRRLNIFFNLEKPCPVPEADCDFVFELTPELCELKFRALAAMPSQTERMIKTAGEEKLRRIIECECLVDADKPREWGRLKSASA